MLMLICVSSKIAMGGRLKAAREAAGLTQADVAEQVRGKVGSKTQGQMIYRYEAGENVPSAVHCRVGS